MLQIRNEQNEALEAQSRKDFEERMLVHLQKFFPDQCKQLGEEHTREAIWYAVERAETYEIVSERDVCKYTDLMFTYGQDYDRDRRVPWAHRILTDKSLKGKPTEKVNKLYDTALADMEKAAGDEGKGR